METMTLFECKVKYDKMMENGIVKKVTEPFIVNAVNFSDAESIFIDDVTSWCENKEFTVTSIKPVKYSEIFRSEDSNDDRFFAAKLKFVMLDEKTGAEKNTTTNVLIQCKDIDSAKRNLEKNMKNTMSDYEVACIKETNIIDLINF